MSLPPCSFHPQEPYCVNTPKQPEQYEAVWNSVPREYEMVSAEVRILWKALMEELGEEGVGFRGNR